MKRNLLFVSDKPNHVVCAVKGKQTFYQLIYFSHLNKCYLAGIHNFSHWRNYCLSYSSIVMENVWYNFFHLQNANKIMLKIWILLNSFRLKNESKQETFHEPATISQS